MKRVQMLDMSHRPAPKNNPKKSIDDMKQRCNDTRVPSAKFTPATVRLDPATHRAMRFVCADLDIAIQEFLRRAVARELAYNAKKVK